MYMRPLMPGTFAESLPAWLPSPAARKERQQGECSGSQGGEAANSTRSFYKEEAGGQLALAACLPAALASARHHCRSRPDCSQALPLPSLTVTDSHRASKNSQLQGRGQGAGLCESLEDRPGQLAHSQSQTAEVSAAAGRHGRACAFPAVRWATQPCCRPLRCLGRKATEKRPLQCSSRQSRWQGQM